MHCFPLTGNIQDPNAHDVQGMLQVYEHAIRNSNLSGPTLFHPIL